MRFIIPAAALLLTGCASDAVLKPAVLKFAADGQAAVATADAGYDALVASSNRRAALLLAANPECGLSTSIFARSANPELDATLRRPGAQAAADSLAAAERRPRVLVPADTYCVSPFEDRVARSVLGSAYGDLRTRTVPVQFLSQRDFAPQRRAVAALNAYVAALAELADAPDLTVQPAIADAIGTLRSVGTDASTVAEQLKLARAPFPAEAKRMLADDGPVAAYAGAVGTLANTLENAVKQARDVRDLRNRILADGNDIETQIRAIGTEADRWQGELVRLRQSEAMLLKAGEQQGFAAAPFTDRLRASEAYLAGVAAAGAGEPSRYGAMMKALADAHAELRRIASGKYTPAERRVLVRATLERLGDALKAIGGVAVLAL